MSNPELGTIFPIKDIGADRRTLIDYGPSVEKLGLQFVVTYDHVVGATPRPDRPTGKFTSEHFTHEPLVFLSAMAAVTEKIKLMTGLLITPQRETALVAKQTADIDILSDGRLVLGVGIGWNKPEYEALGADFKTRTPRLEEQIGLLRRLWTEKDIHYEGEYETLDGVDINPLPVQRPIPIWIGGLSHKMIERAARLADGWLAIGQIEDDDREARAKIFREYSTEYGREPLGLMGQVDPWRKSYERCLDDFKRWVDAGATHVAIGSSHDTYTNSEQYFGDLARFHDYLVDRT